MLDSILRFSMAPCYVPGNEVIRGLRRTVTAVKPPGHDT
jgi:hypothetical protein